MSRSISCPVWLLAIAVCLTGSAAAQQTSRVTLDNSEALFSVMTAISHCGYAPEYRGEVRGQVLNEVAKAVEGSAEAQKSSREMCDFYRDHKQADSARDLAQYVSLALNLGEAPKFDLKVKEADLPPDASYVLGLRPLLSEFAAVVKLHDIWKRHQAQYEAYIEQYHAPVTNMLLTTDVYLRLPMSGYVGRAFTVLIEPMAAPGPVNARNYGADYWLVVSPGQNNLRLDEIRHTYLHYMIDPLVGKRASAMKRMSPMLTTISDAPLDDSYKRDISLLVSESLIRAIEARLAGSRGKQDEGVRQREVEEAMAEGFVLSRYFFDKLAQFEKSDVGLQDALSEWLYTIDVEHERKAAQSQQFTTKAAPEVLSATKREPNALDLAEQRLAAGDVLSARILAEKALKEKQDEGRASFVLARVASLDKDIRGARSYFEQTIRMTKDPHLVAWSHIYLGRIDDIQANRDAAVEHYKAALQAGDDRAETKAAAERGIQEAYEPPRAARDKERQ